MNEASEKINSLSCSHENMLILLKALTDSMENHAKQLKLIETSMKKKDKKRSLSSDSTSPPKKKSMKSMNDKSTPSPSKNKEIKVVSALEKVDSVHTKTNKGCKENVVKKTTDDKEKSKKDDAFEKDSDTEVQTQAQFNNNSLSLSKLLSSNDEFDVNNECDIPNKLSKKTDTLDVVNTKKTNLHDILESDSDSDSDSDSLLENSNAKKELSPKCNESDSDGDFIF
jgi:hypothetical protein